MQARILKNKLSLYMTEFFAGMSVMAVELGASRLLAPYFSSSQIVWTIIIGTIMIAMALGNLYGGNPIHPNKKIAADFDRAIRQTILLAEKLGIHQINTFSGCSGDYEPDEPRKCGQINNGVHTVD